MKLTPSDDAEIRKLHAWIINGRGPLPPDIAVLHEKWIPVHVMELYFQLVDDLKHELECLQKLTLERNNERLADLAKWSDRHVMLRSALEKLVLSSGEVLDAESEYNIEENRKAGCAPGTFIVGGRWKINAAMHDLCRSGENAKKVLEGDGK